MNGVINQSRFERESIERYICTNIGELIADYTGDITFLAKQRNKVLMQTREITFIDFCIMRFYNTVTLKINHDYINNYLNYNENKRRNKGNSKIYSSRAG